MSDTKKACSSCAHFQPTNDLSVGSCSRFPPQAQMVPVGPGAAQVQAFFPPVRRDQVCGEWTAKPVSLVVQ